MTVLELVSVLFAIWVFVIGATIVGWLVIESTGRFAEELLSGERCGTCGATVTTSERIACQDCEVRA